MIDPSLGLDSRSRIVYSSVAFAGITYHCSVSRSSRIKPGSLSLSYEPNPHAERPLECDGWSRSSLFRAETYTSSISTGLTLSRECASSALLKHLMRRWIVWCVSLLPLQLSETRIKLEKGINREQMPTECNFRMGEERAFLSVESSVAILKKIPLVLLTAVVSDRRSERQRGQATPSHQRTCCSRFDATDSHPNTSSGTICVWQR